MSDQPQKPIEGAEPSRNPVNDSSMIGMLKQFMGKALQNTDDCMPAKVIAFDRVSNIATVQPMIKIVATNGESLNRAQIASVPVFQCGGGGFMLNFNLKAGDLGWIKATDRDMSLYLQGGTEQEPNTHRMHSFNDGFFIPDILSGFTIDGEDMENAVWQTLDGTVRIALWPDRVKVTAPRVVIESPIVEVNATSSVTLTTPTTHMTGDLQVDGNITSNQTVTGLIDVMAGTKLLKAHDHGTGTLIAGKTAVNN